MVNASLKIGSKLTVTDAVWDRIHNRDLLTSKKFTVYSLATGNQGIVDIVLFQNATNGEKMGLSIYAEKEEELLQMFIETYSCEKCSSFKGTENEGSFCSKECIKVMQERYIKSISPIK